MNTCLLNGYLVHQRPYLENKHWLTFFTYEQGLVSFLGYRSSKKPCLVYFQPYTLICQIKQDKLKFKQADPSQFSPLFPPSKLWMGLYYNELIYRLCQPDHPQPQLFNCYRDSLSSLQHAHDPSPVIRAFEHNLLKYMGYELCFDCLQNSSQSWFYFDQDEGFKPSTSAVNQHISREVLTELSQQQWTSLAAQKLGKKIFSIILHHLLGDKRLFIKNLVPA